MLSLNFSSGGDWEKDWESARSLYKTIQEYLGGWNQCAHGPALTIQDLLVALEFGGYGGDCKVKTRMVDGLI